MTNVSVISGGVILSTAKTGQDGIARFNLTDGSYFVLLPRTSIYPPFVALVDVRGDTSVKLTKYNCGGACTSNAYGQITGPSSFYNSSVVAYSNGVVAKRAAPNSGGLYALSYIPEGNYELLFESPGFEPLRLQVFLPASDFIEVNAQLVKIALPPEQKTELSSSPQVSQYSVIEVTLSSSGSLRGKTIIATTPSGRVTLTTDSNGKAYINAAEPGTYSFSYAEAGITASSSSKVVGTAVPQNETPVPPVEQPPVQQPPAESTQAFSGIAIVGGVAIALIAVVVIIAVIYIVARSASKKKTEGAKQEHTHRKHARKK